jgi:chromate transporter
MWSLALAAFVAIYFFHVPFPLIIISAGILGLIGNKFLPQYFRGESAHPSDVDLAAKIADRAKPTWLHALKISATWIVIWALPLALAGIFLGTDHTIFREGIFFSKAAVVTFGGAYAVLP